VTPENLERFVGRPVEELDTPALVVDAVAMQANIVAMARFLAERGKQWRPHAKCHKSPEIARLQLEAGAIGVTSAKTSEAQTLAAAAPDVLIANCVVGERKVERVARLCAEARPLVACDHYVQAEMLSGACRRAGATCRVLVEVNLGMHRTGVRPGPDARDLSRAIDRLPGIKLAGVMGYEGHLLQLADRDEKQRRIAAAMSVLCEVRDQFLADGLDCAIVSAGGTGSYQFTAECPGVTEIQAGGGIFADPFYLEACGVTGLTPSLTLLSTLVSRPKLERGVLDCGRKSLSPEVHPSRVVRMSGGWEIRDAGITMWSAEHLTLELGPEARDLRIGDKVHLRPGYSDLTSVLHDVLWLERNGIVEAALPIAGRGKLQ
jgi:D-serine deaminase-like pyridoxal phosphate-dependent protein